jgi:O-antigen/teichoic acid export membrane protein
VTLDSRPPERRKRPGLDALRRLGGRRVAVMADQVVSSLSNVVVAIIVARVVSPDEFGAFSVAMLAFAIVIGGVRAVIGEPWLSAHSAEPTEVRRRISADLLRASVAASALASVLIAGLAVVAGGMAAAPVLALAAVFPVLGVQDALRYVAVVDRPLVALVSDLAWLVAVVPLLAAAPADASPAWFVVAWGVGGLVGLVPALAVLGIPVAKGSVRRWFGTHREMSGAFLGEHVTARISSQIAMLALGAVAGLSALGAVRAAQVFYGPLNTLFGGLYLVLVPDGARQRHDSRRLTRLMVAASGLVTAAAMIWTLVGVVAPDRLGTALFGQTWSEAGGLLLPMGIAMTISALNTGAFAGIRSLGYARLSLRVRLWSMPPQLACCLIGAAAGSALGYTIGFAVGNAVIATMWWVFFAEALRRASARHFAGSRRVVVAPVPASVPGTG